ncbi:unnamed protein product [Caenorhabditis bovis]|uniref:ABC1 atypical kinase-like domain-containing protein n=1 Tax=Caenorhabditis bovis TaxID=2654633 RepID=A0A8S1E999_9PELO|nr:unnamed protein product [Caenorhabditis bovis]
MIIRSFLSLRPISKLFLIGGTSGAGYAVYNGTTLEDIQHVGVFRFGRATIAVAKIVLDYKISLRNIPQPSEEYDSRIKECHQRSAENLLELARVNGGVFIKVFNIFGTALKIFIITEYTRTLGVLMSRAPQATKDDVIYVIESEFNKKVDDIFSEFSDKPVGAASLAQVHVARLKSTNEKVAVKVQHKRVYKNSRTDMNTMELLVNIADAVFPEFKLMWLVNEVKKNLPNELDFLHEAKNADEAAKRFKHLKFLKIPKIKYDYTTKRVLTMEFCEGAQVDDIDYLKKHNIDRHDVCAKIGRTISEMIFLQGYLHSDPHPGNVLINHLGKGKYEIVLLDHGLYLVISDHIRKLYSDLWLAILKPDLQKIRTVACQMGVGELYGLFACIVTRRSWKSVTSGIEKSEMDSNEQNELRTYASSLIPQISDVLARMPREMLLILKTNDLMRNIEHKLNVFGTGDAHFEMCRCVVRSSHELSIQRSDSSLEKLKLSLSMYWSLFKICVFQYYLRLRTVYL